MAARTAILDSLDDFVSPALLSRASSLLGESQAAISKAIGADPPVRFKVGGYTDNVGDPAANMKLSTDRANAVRSDLVSMGVAADRRTAEGYGEQHPIADNSTQEGRAKNRRISIRVLER